MRSCPPSRGFEYQKWLKIDIYDQQDHDRIFHRVFHDTTQFFSRAGSTDYDGNEAKMQRNGFHTDCDSQDEGTPIPFLIRYLLLFCRSASLAWEACSAIPKSQFLSSKLSLCAMPSPIGELQRFGSEDLPYGKSHKKRRRSALNQPMTNLHIKRGSDGAIRYHRSASCLFLHLQEQQYLFIPSNTDQLYMPRLQFPMRIVEDGLQRVVIAGRVGQGFVIDTARHRRLIICIFFIASCRAYFWSTVVLKACRGHCGVEMRSRRSRGLYKVDAGQLRDGKNGGRASGVNVQHA